MNYYQGTRRARKRLATVLGSLFVAYIATWVLGIRPLWRQHQEERFQEYTRDKAFYQQEGDALYREPAWFPLLTHFGGFPSWDQYRDFDPPQVRYFAVFPFVILSHHERNGAVWNEYHLWYIIGSRKLYTDIIIIT